MNVLIIEDENRAANRLKMLLLEIDPEINIIDIIDTVKGSIDFLENHSVDLIFSDIQLADGISTDIFRTVEANCPIIFTTAYNQYAIEAFNTNGIDYILKPIEKERLSQAIHKFKNLSQNAELNIRRIANLIKQSDQPFKKRFMIKVGEKIKLIPVEDINAFYSMNKGTYLLTNAGRNYVIDFSLEELSFKLNPQLFFKINRKVIVAFPAIQEIIAHSNSRLKLVVPHLDLDEIIVARERVNEFKQWLDQ